MKRTEKIEVRLSHEEKQTLSELAEGEGRTVSDLVRGLIERYVSLNVSPFPRKPRWALWSGLVASGLLIGHLGTWGMMRFHHGTDSAAEDNIMSFGLYKLTGMFPQIAANHEVMIQILEAPILVKDGWSEDYVIEREGSDFLVTTQVTVSKNDLPTVQFDVCEQTQNECVSLAKPKLTLMPEETSSVSLMTDQNYRMSFIIDPVSTEVKLKQYAKIREGIKNVARKPHSDSSKY